MEAFVILAQLVIWALMIGGLVYAINLAVGLHKAFRDLDESLEVAKKALSAQSETNQLLSQILEELHASR